MKSLSTKEQGIALGVKQLQVKKGGKTILQNLNFSIAPNQFVGLLGPSGSGKSTLLRACCGLEKPQGSASEKTVTWDNAPLYAQLDRWRQHMGYVPQDDIIHTALTVEKAVHYAARLRLDPQMTEKTRSALVTRVIHEVDLQERRSVKISRLSGGQRKRASVAVELLQRPRILFLDEPTSGQDPQLEESMMLLFRGLSRQGSTVIVTTHAMASIELLDQVILLQAGQLVYQGPPQDMLDFFGSRSYEGIYRILAKSKPAQWIQKAGLR